MRRGRKPVTVGFVNRVRRVILELAHDTEPIIGSVVSGDRPPRDFAGYADLIAALEELEGHREEIAAPCPSTVSPDDA